ncbi:MAG: protein kinase family protein [Frankia sp.]|nr:protein kinase family protein [Frankia sp.]
MVEAGNRPQSADVDNDVTTSASPGGMTDAGGSTLLAESVLDRRYRLIGVLSSRGPVTLWRGDDTVLTRPVAVRVVEHSDNDPARRQAAESLLAAAVNSGRLVHPGAASTYDATVTTTEHGQVSYVITEWVDGRTLREIAAEGPPRPEQAAAVVLGAARVIAAAHERGLHHGGLRPGDVIVSGHGTVKVIDLEVGGVLARLDGTAQTDSTDPATLAAADVRALGGLLYAALTGYWPLPGDTGLPPAPYGTYGRLQSPRQLNHAVPRDLDAITMAAVLGDESIGEPITTAADLIAELEAVTPADVLHDTGLMAFGETEPMPTGFDDTYGQAGYGADTPGYGGYGGGYQDDGYGGYRDDYDRTRYAAGATGYRDDGYPPPQRGYPPADAGRPAGPGPAPAPGPRAARAAAAANQRSRRRPMVILSLVVVAVLVAAVVLALQLTGGDGGTPNDDATTPPATVAGTPLQPAGAISLDPPPGDGEEKPADVRLAIDGDRSTQWTTDGYNHREDNTQFGGLKEGVGIRVAFSSPVRPTSVLVTVGTLGPVTFELRAGNTDSRQDVSAYQIIGNPVTGQANGTVEIAIPSDAPESSYWVVWLTRLPQGADGDPTKDKGSIAEIEFRS